MSDKITSFRGEYSFLSNFYRSPIKWKGREYPTVEHAYQTAKATEERYINYISSASTPGQARFRGRLMPPSYLLPDWDKKKLEIMRELVTLKFKQNRKLMKELKATGDAVLIEGNTWKDTYWGVCNGKGSNWLGKILMEIRDGKPR